MPKVSSIGIKVDYDYSKMEITCHVWDYKAEKAIKSEVFPMHLIPESIKGNIMLYGLSKVLQDRNSGEKDKALKLAGMIDTFDQLCEGTWKAERESGPRLVPVEIEALARLKKVSAAAIQATKAKLTDEQWAKVLADPTVIAEIASVKKEREQQQEVNFDDLLNA